MANDVMLQVRLRPGKDDALITWYLAQADRSAAVRAALREYLRNGEPPSAADPLQDLPGLVTAAVRAALADVQLAAELPPPDNGSDENPALAARLDDQLNSFWET